MAPAVVLVCNRFEHPVIEWQHVVVPRLFPPQRDEFGDLFRKLGGEVTRLRDVVGHVIQLPDIVVPR